MNNDITTNPAATYNQDQTGGIAASVDGLRLKFPGEDIFVFKDFNFHVKKGEKVLLLGPSGSGKSTLLQVLSGIIPSLVEVPMRCAEQTLPTSWGFVFQDPDTQFCMPFVDEELAFVLENLAVPRDEMECRMKEVLEAVGLHLEELHVGIDTLSHGMKQRLALASVLLSDPDVLFLDEPSSLLDPEGRVQIWEAVRNIAEGRTIIIVEHRIEEIADFVDRVVLFGPNGQIIGDGSPDEVFVRYLPQLQEYGIWYPGVWDDYLASEEGNTLFGELASSEISASVHLQSDGSESGAARPLLELSDYRGLRLGRTVIEVDRAEVYPGDFIAITGPNGAGKSSLLLSLMGLLNGEGMYVLAGKPFEGTSNRKRRIIGWRRERKTAADTIGFVFQNPEFQFVAERTDEEIAFSLRQAGLSVEEISVKVGEALRSFGLVGLEHRHPYQLSLGQKRRLSVAGVTVLDKPLIFLDEPTFGQDAVNTFAILRVCEGLRRKGAAIIMVTHEEYIAEHFATHRWEIRRGRLTSQRLTLRGENGRHQMDNVVTKDEGSRKKENHGTKQFTGMINEAGDIVAVNVGDRREGEV